MFSLLWSSIGFTKCILSEHLLLLLMHRYSLLLHNRVSPHRASTFTTGGDSFKGPFRNQKYNQNNKHIWTRSYWGELMKSNYCFVPRANLSAPCDIDRYCFRRRKYQQSDKNVHKRNQMKSESDYGVPEFSLRARLLVSKNQNERESYWECGSDLYIRL